MYQQYIWWCRQVRQYVPEGTRIKWRDMRGMFLNDWSPRHAARIVVADANDDAFGL